MRISNTFVEGEEGQHKATNVLVLPVPNDSTLISLYENEKQLAMESYQHHLLAPVLQQGFLSAISLVLFLIHWRWVRRARSIQP